MSRVAWETLLFLLQRDARPQDPMNTHLDTFRQYARLKQAWHELLQQKLRLEERHKDLQAQMDFLISQRESDQVEIYEKGLTQGRHEVKKYYDDLFQSPLFCFELNVGMCAHPK